MSMDETPSACRPPAPVKQLPPQPPLPPDSGRCFDVAVDHGMLGEAALLTGIEDMEAAIDTLVDAKPRRDPALPRPGRLLQRHPGRDKPALVLRTDTPNIYAPEPPAEAWSLLVDDPVGLAIRLDAACVVRQPPRRPRPGRLRRDCLEAISRLRAECDRAGMPLMVEPLAFDPAAEAATTRAATPTASAASCARRSSSAPTSSRPTRPTTSPTTTASSPSPRVPVLLRGGGRVSDQEILERTHAVIEQGAAGIVYGRNVIQHAEPGGDDGALMSVVHEGATPTAVDQGAPRRPAAAPVAHLARCADLGTSTRGRCRSRSASGSRRTATMRARRRDRAGRGASRPSRGRRRGSAPGCRWPAGRGSCRSGGWSRRPRAAASARRAAAAARSRRGCEPSDRRHTRRSRARRQATRLVMNGHVEESVEAGRVPVFETLGADDLRRVAGSRSRGDSTRSR